MNRIRVGAANLNQSALDWEGNTRRIMDAIQQAQAEKVGILCLPELCISGYGCEDAFLSLENVRKSEDCLEKIIDCTENIVVAVGLPIFFRGHLFNCGALIQNKKLLGIHAKKALAREGIHYEPRWFSAWPVGRKSDYDFRGQLVPIGDLHFQFEGMGVTIEICEEAWGPNQGSAALAHRSEVVLNLSASHFSFGKDDLRKNLVENASRSLRTCYVYSNLCGLDSGRVIYDGGSMIGRAGQIISRAPRLTLNETDLTVADIDLDQIKMEKFQSHSVKASLEDIAHRQSEIVVAGKSIENLEDYKLYSEVKESLSCDFEDFYSSATLGLFDYLRKSRAKGFVVSLSGGCDSSVVSVLIAQMFHRAQTELSKERLVSCFPFLEGKKNIVECGLTTIYQSSANSGNVTKNAAKELASALGSSHYELDVSGIISSYEKMYRDAKGEELNWNSHDLALQNIQARSRAPSAWLFANAEGKLLISTGNRSEVALGYMTMDGDTSGGLAPIAGVDKHFLRKWLIWVEKDCVLGLGPIPALKYVNDQQPTAELRPNGSGQTDEEDLMPYEIISSIEELWVQARLDSETVIDRLQKEFPEHKEGIREYFNKFQNLWKRNQWKRERLAPGFHLDRFNLDSRTWCRYPILS